jgi:alginate O-acetyltransferase complex protein AlgI
MSFDSYEYVFLFLPIVFLLYRFAHASALHNWVLVAASLFFYAWGNPFLIFLLLFVSIQDYIIGNMIAASASERWRKCLIVVSVGANLLLLAAFKYLDWFVGLWNTLNTSEIIPWLHYDLALTSPNLPLPVGISFYTFHTISYTVDIYRRRMVPKTSLIDYLSFVSFFPLLVAGPIQRASHLLPQISRRRPPVSYRNAEYALFLIFWGLMKKMVFADNLGKLVERCQEHLTSAGAGIVLAYAFCFQIYFDFSAYTDIARGSAKLFNIRLTPNFLTPYFSRSPSEFWRRWHISLSTFLRDYLYIPLGGNRYGTARTYLNLMLTMFLGGLWHGAGVFFVLWGLYHGAFLCLYRALPLDRYMEAALGVFGRVLSTLLMFQITVFGWVLFFSNPDNFQPIMHSIRAGLTTIGADVRPLFYGLALFTVPMIIPDICGYRRGREFIDLYPALKLPVRVGLYLFIFYSIVFFARRSGYAFIYFRF